MAQSFQAVMESEIDRGPPPPYEDETFSFAENKKQSCVKVKPEDVCSTNACPTEENGITEAPPPYEKEVGPTCSREERFTFIQSVSMRSWLKFLSLPRSCPNCDAVSQNFGYNLWFFQINYGILLAVVVLIAMQKIDNPQFNFEVYVTAFVMAMVYWANSLGCQPQALGRKITMSEQLTVIFLIFVVFNGLLPEAFDFLYFIGSYMLFVIIHASIAPIRKPCLLVAQIQHM